MSAQKTAPDWLRFRTKAEVPAVLDAMRPLFGDMGEWLHLGEHGKGKDGFQQGYTVKLCQMDVGRFDYGGDSQRGWVRANLTGAGCAAVTDWDAVEEVAALPACEARRLDLALTTYRGEVTHEGVVAAHAAGLFASGSGGRPPALRQIISSDPRAGRTCYVGSRQGDKMLRAYEKGFEVAGKFPDGHLTHIDGFPVEDVYRLEVELKAETRPVPWDAVHRRDQYFAGCYPYLAQVLPDVACEILVGAPHRAAVTDLAAALAHCKHQYGAALFTALHAYGGDMTAVWDRICGDSHHVQLVAAGVLMAVHE